MSEITVSDRRQDVDFEFVHGFLSQQSQWAQGIGPETLSRALDHSLCVSVFVGKDQVGFARVVTDYATFAWIDDVFVDESFRGNRIAHRMLSAIVNHERLATVPSWFLSSSNPKARQLFKQLGFARPETERLEKVMARPKLAGPAYTD